MPHYQFVMYINRDQFNSVKLLISSAVNHIISVCTALGSTVICSLPAAGVMTFGESVLIKEHVLLLRLESVCIKSYQSKPGKHNADKLCLNMYFFKL